MFFHRFRRHGASDFVLFVCPQAQINQPAALAAKRAKFVVCGIFDEFTTSWARHKAFFYGRHFKCAIGQWLKIAKREVELYILLIFLWLFRTVELVKAHIDSVFVRAYFRKVRRIIGDLNTQHL